VKRCIYRARDCLRNMEKTKRVFVIIAVIAGMLCSIYFGLWLALCLIYPSEFAPDTIIQWQNKSRAARYRSAAERGNAEAQLKLGSLYFSGIGVPFNQAEAVKWFLKAAEQGDSEAHCRLAYCYFNGNGVPEDRTEAMRRYHIAAELGNVNAQWRLGAYYLNGIEVPKDAEEAVKWFRKAAEQDYYHAQYLLGRCYFEGTGVLKNDTEAAKWLRKIDWHSGATELLKEIGSDNPREPNPEWGKEII